MLLRPERQNVESFLDAVAKHVAGPWRIVGDGRTVVFGIGAWRADVALDTDDSDAPEPGTGILSGIHLDNEEYDDGETATVEEAIALLEGLGYEEDDG